jgi:hypothetical protein
MLSDIRNCIALFEGSQASPAYPSDKSIIEVKMVWSIVGVILSGENRCAGGKKPVPLPLCSLQSDVDWPKIEP